MDSKKFWSSKTFWFGVLWLVVGVAGIFGYGDFTPGSDLVEVAQIINGVIIILLRFLTNRGLSL